MTVLFTDAVVDSALVAIQAGVPRKDMAVVTSFRKFVISWLGTENVTVRLTLVKQLC